MGAWWRNVTVNLRFLAGGVVLVGVAVLVGASIVVLEGGDSVRGWPIEDARQFDQFSLFWLGEEFEGMPLRRIVYASSEKVVIFIYGSCNPRGEGGCALPLSLTIEPCNLEPHGGGGSFEIRGARAAFSRAGHLRVWTRDVTVTVFAASGLDMRAAGALRLVSEGPEGAEKELEPPGYPC